MDSSAINPELPVQERPAVDPTGSRVSVDTITAGMAAAFPVGDGEPSEMPTVEELRLEAGGAAKLSREERDKYTRIYGKGWRTIYRWIEEGEAAGDRCPLEDPVAMVRWWPKHHTWRVPPEIEAAAVVATREAAAAASAATAATPPAASSVPVAKVQTGEGSDPGKALDIEAFDPAEGSRLRELQQVQAAKFAEWKAALSRGDSNADVLERRYLNLSDSIDKMETRLTARMHKMGLYILRSEVERDLAANAELLRQSAEAMARRILELCPSLNAEQRAEVEAGVTRAREAEARTFTRLPSLTTNDLLRELQAA